MILKRFLSRSGRTSHARGIYDVIVAQARQPWFYADLGVPDTVSGRYDMIVLHAFLVFDRLNGAGKEASALAQKVCDEMFADMDRSLREMGVGDMSISKRMRKLAEIFQGRSNAYGNALACEGGSAAALKDVLLRNIYPDGVAEDCLAEMAGYVGCAWKRLSSTDDADMKTANFNFPDPARAGGTRSG